MTNSLKRFIGLDVHKHYLIALGVDEQLNVVLPARRVELARLEAWMKKSLTQQDEVVLEMTTPFGPGAPPGRDGQHLEAVR